MPQYLNNNNTALHGLKIDVSGRFKASNRSRDNEYQEGAVPFNTMRADIDYTSGYSITLNGSFGWHIWACYKDKTTTL